MDTQSFDTQPSENEAIRVSPDETGTVARPAKHRPTFTESQIAAMEKIFEQRQYLSPIERETLSTAVGLTPQQVRVWFQNRRQKVKQFLSQRRNSQQNVNGDKQNTLTPQQLSSSIDPILQLLLPKVIENGTTNETKQDSAPELTNGKQQPADESNDASAKDDEEEESTTPIAPPVLTPQALLCLTPYLMPSGNMSIQLSTSPAGSNITIPSNAIQLLQGLVSVSSPSSLTGSGTQGGGIPLAKFAAKLANQQQQQQSQKSPGELPLLKAQSPTRITDIEGSEIKSEELGATGTEGDPTEPNVAQEESKGTNTSEEVPAQEDGNQVLATISSEVLQQLLLNLTGGGGVGGGANDNNPKATYTQSEGNTPVNNTLQDGSSPRKRRQVFSGVQTTELEKQFEICPYIDSKERERLAEKIGLHPDQVKVWFQNRRTKKTRISWRQHNKEPTEQ